MGFTLEDGLGLGISGLLLELGHLGDDVGKSDGEVLVGDGGGRADSVEHLLLGLGAGLLGLKAKGLDGSIGGLAESSDLGVELVVDEELGVLVHLLATLLDELGTLLASGDGLADGSLELGLVGVLGGLDLLAADLGLHGVLVDETSELLDLLVGLLVVLGDLGSELVDLLLEGDLGLADVVHGIEAHATDVGGHTGVLDGLLLLHGEESREDLVGGALKTVLGVGTVLGELLAHLAEGGVEGVLHLVEVGVNLLLVLVDELVELDVLLGPLLVTLVTELDHTVHLSVHVGVHLGLGSLVGTDNTGSLVHTLVHLGHLLGDGGLELQKANLVVDGGGSDLGLGLGLGSSDVTLGLSETLVLESLLGVEGGSELLGGVLQGHVDGMTVLGHLGVDIVELGSGGGNETLDLVVGPGTGGLVLLSELSRELGVLGSLVLRELGNLVVPVGHGILKVLAGLLGILLDLGSVGSNMLVHAIDLGVGGGSPRAGGLLPAGDGKTKVVSLLLTVGVDHAKSLLVASLGTGLTAVGKVGLLGEALLGAHHGTVELVAALLGVDSHVVKHLPAKTSTGSSVESEVAGHLGTDCRDVGLAVGDLIANLLLNIVEVINEAHAAIRGLGVDLTSLQHVSAANRGPGIVPINGLHDVLITGISGDVHDRAANGKATQKYKGNKGVRHLLLRGLGVHPFRSPHDTEAPM